MTTEERIKRCFNKACTDYGLLHDGDKILVALSGGKDSLELCRLLGERKRIFKPSILVEAAHVVMDNIPYESDTAYLEQFCQECGITLHILHSHFDESTDERKTKCFLCAWNRRKALFNYASEHGFNKLALGHHQDDILVTWLMNVTYEGNASTMRPLMPMRHYPLQVIRPLCLVHEDWIREVAQEQGFERQKRQCPYETASVRSDMEALFRQITQLNPEARASMWHAIDKLEQNETAYERE